MYQSPTTPRAHQLDALARLHEHPEAFALLMEMGTGKTKVILDEWGERVSRGELNDLLVLAPAGAYDNWCRISEEDPGEIQKHLDADLRYRTTVFKWKSSKKKLALGLLAVRGPRILVMNTEALSSVVAAQELCEKFLSRGCAMMVVDESTAIKSPRARRTRSVLKLGSLAACRRIATGLVAPRSPLDLYTQFEFLDWRILGFQSFYAFRARYAITKKMMFGGRKVQLVVGYRNVEELQQRIAPYSFRVLKEDCLDLEPKTYETRDVQLSAEQLRLYTEIKKYATTALDATHHVTATAVITQILRLHQLLCGQLVDELGTVHDIPERRTDELVAILEEHAGKAIIWTAYGASLNKISARLRKEFGPNSVAQFWGGNRNDREDDERRFKTDPECRFMVATPQAGGKGNTWTVANLVVYYSNTYDLEARAQSEDRPHRDGQTQKVTYVDLVARGTVDEKILQALRKKIDMATIISGDNYREWLI